jgi:hypothetical protein
LAFKIEKRNNFKQIVQTFQLINSISYKRSTLRDIINIGQSIPPHAAQMKPIKHAKNAFAISHAKEKAKEGKRHFCLLQ